jgi:hypothetical protein
VSSGRTHEKVDDVVDCGSPEGASCEASDRTTDAAAASTSVPGEVEVGKRGLPCQTGKMWMLKV